MHVSYQLVGRSLPYFLHFKFSRENTIPIINLYTFLKFFKIFPETLLQFYSVYFHHCLQFLFKVKKASVYDEPLHIFYSKLYKNKSDRIITDL